MKERVFGEFLAKSEHNHFARIEVFIQEETISQAQGVGSKAPKEQYRMKNNPGGILHPVSDSENEFTTSDGIHWKRWNNQSR